MFIGFRSRDSVLWTFIYYHILTYLRSWSHGVETVSDSLPAFFPVNLHGLTARNIVRPEALAQWQRNTTKHDETAQLRRGNEQNSKANRSSNGSARPSKAFIFMRSRSKVSLTCTRILKATAHCSEVSLPTVLFRNSADSTQQKSPSFCFLPAWWVLSMAKERTAIRKARVQGIALKRAGFLQKLATRNPLIAGHLPR